MHASKRYNSRVGTWTTPPANVRLFASSRRLPLWARLNVRFSHFRTGSGQSGNGHTLPIPISIRGLGSSAASNRPLPPCFTSRLRVFHRPAVQRGGRKRRDRERGGGRKGG